MQRQPNMEQKWRIQRTSGTLISFVSRPSLSSILQYSQKYMHARTNTCSAAVKVTYCLELQSWQKVNETPIKNQ